MMAVTQNNVYVHSNPPKAISGQGAAIRNWVKNGDLEKLESVVLEGQGARLLGLMESTGDVKVKAFLKSIPGYMAKVDLIHDAVIRGSLRETQALIDKKKLATARDAVGRGLAHKAVLYNHKPLLDWLSKKYPETIHLKDNEGRTCLHYTAANKEPEELFDVLVSLGATPETIDIHGRKPGYYVNHPEELDIEGPYTNNNSYNNNNNNTRSLSRGNRMTTTRRISPISPKSVGGSSPSSMNITRAQIRIWIHERDISKLERIVWSGNGDKLLIQTTNNSKVRRFLDNVPHLLSRIKQIHTSAIQNDVATLKQLKARTEITELFTAKDTHGLTPLHKAAGLGNRAAVEYLIYEIPTMLNEPDNEGRTPLHYASRDPSLYGFLVRAGADESIVDSKGKTPNFYRTHSNELDTKHLRNIPDAPRVSGELTGWERGFSPQLGMMTNKRKKSTGEFSQDSMNGQNDEEVDVSIDDVGNNILAKSSGIGGRRESVKIKKHTNSGVTKFRRTEESADEIEDVNDGYVADSDEGKYELSTDFEIQPMEEELDDELDKELQAIGDSSNNPTPNDLMIEEQVKQSMENRRRSRVKSVAENVVSEVEEAAKERIMTPADHEPEGITDIQQPKMEDDVPEHEFEPERQNVVPVELPETNMNDLKTELKDQEVNAEDALGLTEEAKIHAFEGATPPPNYEHVLDPNGMDTSVQEPGVIYDVDSYVKNGDMEKLVEMILEGHGAELIDKDSSIHEVQEFLVNVPAYMAKIASIHSAASSGNVRDLQSLLDRKRLAQAKDELGRAPLHQAVLNGHSNVTRYLASNYPLSLNMMDMNKRTPLHYAATLPDQGALYKVLIQAGSDPNLKDLHGNTPGIYLRRKDLLTQADLMNMSPQNLSGQPLQRKESTVDSWERPATPIPLDEATMEDNPVSGRLLHRRGTLLNYEAEMEVEHSQLNLLNNFYQQISKEESIWSRTWRRLTSKKGTTDIAKKYVHRYLKPEVFNLIKTRSTPRYGATLLDCIKFYPQFFIVAPDPHAYTTFRELFLPAIADHNGFGPSTGIPVGIVHPPMVFQGQVPLCNKQDIPIVDLPSKYVRQVRLRLSRNIRPFPFVSILNKEGLYEIQSILTNQIGPRVPDWDFIDLSTLEKEERDEVIETRGLWFPDATKISRSWPKARCCYINSENTKTIWINGQDHLDLIISSRYGRVGSMLGELDALYRNIGDDLEYHYNSQTGFLTLDPFRCGTGLKITFRLRLPHLMRSRSELTSECDSRNLFIQWNNKGGEDVQDISPDDWVELENIRTFGLNENEIGKQTAEAVNELIKIEESRARAVDLAATAPKKP